MKRETKIFVTLKNMYSFKDNLCLKQENIQSCVERLKAYWDAI